jgi:predicted nucleic acid-binding protein
VIVVDASAILEVLLNTPAGARVSERIFLPGETLRAPHLLDVEVAQVLRRNARAREMDSARGLEALAEALAASLVTRDAALASVRAHRARIELF